MKQYNNKQSQIEFISEAQELNLLLDSIKKFGEIKNSNNEFKFIFKEGKNYIVTNNGKIATRNVKSNGFDCCIIGNKEIPKNKISKWKFKINSDITNPYIIGVGPNNPDNVNYFYKKYWSFDCNNRQLILNSGSYSPYINNKYNDKLKKGDIITVEINRIDNSLSFSINDNNCGIACSNIPNNDTLYPIILFFNSLSSIEILD